MAFHSFFKLHTMKDSISITLSYLGVFCRNVRLYTLSDYGRKDRLEYYYKICRITLFLVSLLTVRQSYLHAEIIILPIIAQIESSGNPQAIGDNGQALGLYQLHQGVITDYNRHHNTSYSHRIALNPQESQKIAYWYVNKEIPRLIAYYRKKGHKIEDSLESRIIAYNAGIGTLIKHSKGTPLPKITQDYITKYRRLSHADF